MRKVHSLELGYSDILFFAARQKVRDAVEFDTFLGILVQQLPLSSTDNTLLEDHWVCSFFVSS